jgi:hypothetical protein
VQRINFELLLRARGAAWREPSPLAGVIDSQSVKTIESGGFDTPSSARCGRVLPPKIATGEVVHGESLIRANVSWEVTIRPRP